MTEHEAFLRQAQSDFRIFDLFRSQYDHDQVPDCHLLHHLQMATEKLSKAILGASSGSSPPKTHDTFSTFIERLARSDAELAFALGWGDPDEFRRYLGRLRPWCCEVERLNPAPQRRQNEPEGGRNVEYPWEEKGAFLAPADADFGDWRLRAQRASAEAAEVVQFVRLIFDYYDEVAQGLPAA